LSINNKLGLLLGKHAGGQKALWIERTAEAEARLGGQARFDPRMTSVKSLCKFQSKTWEQVIRWCVEEGHQIYRLRRGTTFRFYVLPAGNLTLWLKSCGPYDRTSTESSNLPLSPPSHSAVHLYLSAERVEIRSRALAHPLS
jgi:hypothetical protein